MGWSERDIPDLVGRTAVVTGANGGLGLETARGLAGKGAAVVMAVRNVEKGRAAREVLLRLHPSGSLEIVELDVSSFDSVRSAAREILSRHARLDILVNNAGVMGIPYRETVDGQELQFATSHLGHFLLTALLLPALRRSDAGRVVSVTSTGRLLGRTVDPDDVTMRDRYDSWRSYGRAKLSTAQFTVELERRLRAAGAPVRALAADPGFAHTDLQANSARESRGLSHRFFDTTVGWVGSTPAAGALPLLRAATDTTLPGGILVGLRFLIRGSPVRHPYLSPFMRRQDCRRLWEVSERETQIRFDVPDAVRQATAADGDTARADDG